MANEIRADEPGAASDEKVRCDGSVCATAFAPEWLLSLFPPVLATRLFARSRDRCAGVGPPAVEEFVGACVG